MDDLAKLQYLSLVSKVCAELDAHLGVSDKTLAEFIIDLAQKHPELGAFRAALDENGAEFPASFASNLLALVAKMMPKKKKASSIAASSSAVADGPKERFAGLAVANDSEERRRQLELDALGPMGAVADPAAGVSVPGGREGDWRCPGCGANVFASKDRCFKCGSGREASRGGGAGSSSGAGSSGGASSSGMAPPPPPRGAPDPNAPPEPGCIYAGKVSNVMDFGCFVQLEGVKGRAEGLVHISLITQGQLRTPHDAVKRGQPCFVKVLSVTGSKRSGWNGPSTLCEGTALPPAACTIGAPRPLLRTPERRPSSVEPRRAACGGSAPPAVQKSATFPGAASPPRRRRSSSGSRT